MPAILSAGHSTRSAAELIALLREGGVALVADVRRFPSSRRHPQHDAPALEAALGEAGIGYVWLGESLGGRRAETVPIGASRNRAWEVPAFRHYADAMTSPGFTAGLARLEALARQRTTAILCAERLWWQCHRRLLADLLLVRGWEVSHLLEPGKIAAHELPPFARVEGGTLTYPTLL